MPLRFYSIFLRNLKSKRLIFLINCRCNLTINIVSRAKKMRNEWLTMPTLTKENVFLDSNLSPGLFSVTEEAEVDAHDWNQGNWKGNILKSGREKLTDFCGTCHGKSFFQLAVPYVLVIVFLGKIQSLKISWKTRYLHTFFHTQINLVSKQLKWVRTFKLTK